MVNAEIVMCIKKKFKLPESTLGRALYSNCSVGYFLLPPGLKINLKN